MRRFLSSVCLLQVAIASTLSAKPRQVLLRWKPFANSFGYDLLVSELRSAQQRSFHSRSNTWQSRLACGNYTVKIRSKDRSGRVGDWGHLTRFAVPLASVTYRSPLHQGVLLGSSLPKHPVRFAWFHSEDAVAYDFELQGADGTPLLQRRLSSTAIVVNLATARNYRWRVVPRKAGCRLEPDSLAYVEFSLRGAKLAAPKLLLASAASGTVINWDRPKGSEYYRVSLFRRSDGVWTKIVDKADMVAKQFSIGYDHGEDEYRLEVQARAKNRVASDTTVLSFQHRFARDWQLILYGGWTPLSLYVKTSNATLANGNINIPMHEAFTAGSEYRLDNFGLFGEYFSGNRQISFANDASGLTDSLDILQSRISLGLVGSYRHPKATLSLKPRYSLQNVNTITTQGISVLAKPHSVRTAELLLEAQVSMLSLLWTFRPYYGFLLKSKPFKWKDYVNYGIYFGLEYRFFDALSFLVFYNYDRFFYDFDNSDELPSRNDVTGNMIGFMLRIWL